MERTVQSTSVLAVEGRDESNFFTALLKHMGIDGVQVVDIGGKDKFGTEFTAFRGLEKFGKIERLGFVRDAETGQAPAAFSSICGVLKKCALPVPKQPGTIAASKTPRVGIFIMPDNAESGMLEDLCLKTIEGRPVRTCIDDFLRCFLKQQNDSERPLFNDSKARVQAYLATRSPIRNSLGLGAAAGFWDFAHPCFSDVKEFLEALYR
jgi:hypothetical protein